MIFDIQRFSTHDGPGIRTVVFFKGCPLHCPWCENPEGQSPRPELLYTHSRCLGCHVCLRVAGQALRPNSEGGVVVERAVEPAAGLASICPAGALRLAGRDAPASEILAEVLKDRVFFSKSGGGLTVSGGEPLARLDEVEELLRAAFAEGLDIAIETCLAVPRQGVERVAGLPLRWLADLKHTDPRAFRDATGGDIELVLENLRYLAGLGVELTLRVPLVPGFNDDEAAMRGILDFAAALPRPASGPRALNILPYHDLAIGKYGGLDRSYAFAPGTKLAPGKAEAFAELGKQLGLDITIGG